MSQDNKILRYDIYCVGAKWQPKGVPADGFVQPNQAWQFVERQSGKNREVLRQNGFEVKRRVRITGANVLDAAEIVGTVVNPTSKVGVVVGILGKLLGKK